MTKIVDRDSMALMFNRLDDSPGNYMKRVVYKWGKSLEDILDGLDTTATQLELLAAVANLMNDGKLVTQKDVCEFTRRDKNTVSGVLRALENKGYITRSARDVDLRSKYLVVTEEGFRLVEKALHEVLIIDERFFPDDDDRKELKKLLKKYL